MAPSHKQWVIPFAVQLIPGGLLFAGSFWLRESPRYLLSKKKRDLAIKNLCWIRNLPADDLYLVEEVATIESALAEQERSVGVGFWKPFQAVFRSKSIQWRFFLGGILFMWQNGSGINAINYYSPTVFKSIGIVGTNTSFLTTGIFGVVKTTLTIIWILFLIDHLGRRKLLMGGALGGSLCMWWIGAFIKLRDVKNVAASSAKMSSGGIATVFFFYLWTAFYTPSWNGTPWVINSEIYDQNVRALGQAWAASNNWFWNFLISRFTPQMFNAMSYGVYFLFASVMLLSVPFVYFLIPETKSIPLEAMDRLFSIKPVRHANKTILDKLRQEEEDFHAHAGDSGLTTVNTKASIDKYEKV